MPAPNLKEQLMKTRRHGSNKRRSAKQFRRNVAHTKSINVRPMRGGYRL